MRPKLVLLAVVVALLASCTSVPRAMPPTRSEPAGTHVSGSPAGQAGAGEEGERLGEEGEGEADRIERTGLAPRTGPIHRKPPAGWAGERLFGNGNDWEPAVATDPSAPYVYMITTRYSGHGPLPCERCDIPAIALKVSADGGQTFGPVSYMPVDVPGGQYDPQIETDAGGSVYAAWINGNFRIVFSRSDDQGATWTDPVVVHEGVGWGDHPWIGVSADGKDIYIAFNHADSYVAYSHDGGTTWATSAKLNHQDRYHYANGLVVAPDGTVTVTNANYPRFQGYAGPVKITASRSTDGGLTWQTTIVDVVQISAPCRNHGCPPNHYGGMAALAGDANGDLVVVYDGSRLERGAQYIYASRSDDGGATWSHAERISPGGRTIIATEPAAVGTGDGDIRVIWLDDRNGIERWNAWYTRSLDGGRTWSDEVDIADATSGRRYVHPGGFDADYGDYGEIDVTSTGQSFAIWGEGFSYAGPGDTWYNRET